MRVYLIFNEKRVCAHTARRARGKSETFRAQSKMDEKCPIFS